MQVSEVDHFFQVIKRVAVVSEWEPASPGGRRHELVAELEAEGRILAQQLVLTALADLGKEKAKAQIFGEMVAPRLLA